MVFFRETAAHTDTAMLEVSVLLSMKKHVTEKGGAHSLSTFSFNIGKIKKAKTFESQAITYLYSSVRPNRITWNQTNYCPSWDMLY